MIWPILPDGLAVDHQKTFRIPTGRDWAVSAGAPPLEFLDNTTIAVADPVGMIYTLSTDAKPIDSFSTGKCLLPSWCYRL